jgi:hypothetical protein
VVIVKPVNFVGEGLAVVELTDYVGRIIRLVAAFTLITLLTEEMAATFRGRTLLVPTLTAAVPLTMGVSDIVVVAPAVKVIILSRSNLNPTSTVPFVNT